MEILVVAGSLKNGVSPVGNLGVGGVVDCWGAGAEKASLVLGGTHKPILPSAASPSPASGKKHRSARPASSSSGGGGADSSRGATMMDQLAGARAASQGRVMFGQVLPSNLVGRMLGMLEVLRLIKLLGVPRISGLLDVSGLLGLSVMSR